MIIQHAICVIDLLDSQKCKECSFTEDPLDEVCCKKPRLLTRQNSNSLPSLIVSFELTFKFKVFMMVLIV